MGRAVLVRPAVVMPGRPGRSHGGILVLTGPVNRLVGNTNRLEPAHVSHEPVAGDAQLAMAVAIRHNRQTSTARMRSVIAYDH